MATAGTPIDRNEKIIAELHKISPTNYEGTTTLNKRIKIYFNPPNLTVNLDPYGVACYSDEENKDHTLQRCLFLNGFGFSYDYMGIADNTAKKHEMNKEETINTDDLEAFMHRLLKVGLSPSDVSREGLNYAISMMSPSLSVKDSLDQASKLLEKAVRNIGISSDQLKQEQQRSSCRHYETK